MDEKELRDWTDAFRARIRAGRITPERVVATVRRWTDCATPEQIERVIDAVTNGRGQSW